MTYYKNVGFFLLTVKIQLSNNFVFCLVKKIYILLLLSSLSNIYGQCTVTFTDTNPHNPVCTPQETVSYSSGIIRFNIQPMLGSNLYSFTTVGSSAEDTHLALYNSSGVLLAENDDATNWVGCKQSTIEYEPTEALNGAYLILSKKGCQELTSLTSVFYNTINPYNQDPVIIEPSTPFYPCKNGSALFNAINNDGTAIASPSWRSSDSSIATVDANTGLINFINAGLVKIYLTGALTCEVFKTYLVVETVTSAITHD